MALLLLQKNSYTASKLQYCYATGNDPLNAGERQLGHLCKMQKLWQGAGKLLLFESPSTLQATVVV